MYNNTHHRFFETVPLNGSLNFGYRASPPLAIGGLGGGGGVEGFSVTVNIDAYFHRLEFDVDTI